MQIFAIVDLRLIVHEYCCNEWRLWMTQLFRIRGQNTFSLYGQNGAMPTANETSTASDRCQRIARSFFQISLWRLDTS